jgi:hypothetical protein
MAAPPARTELADTYPLPSNDTYRTGIGRLWDYLTERLGLGGTVADARAALAVASTGELQAQTFKAFTTGGTSTAFTLTTAPAIAALAANQEYDITFHVAPGLNPTLARDGLAAKALKYCDNTGAKHVITSIPINWRSRVVYDGTDYIVREMPMVSALQAVAPVAFGYKTGAGGSTSQATSKSTAVTLNTPTGRINVFAAEAMAPGAIVSFVFNNSSMNAGDNLSIQVNTAGDAVNYRAWHGDNRIFLENISAGSLSTGPGLYFAVIPVATT